MKAKQELLDSLNRLHEILDREIAELHTSKREHHKSWDAHIMTLSMASIGFVFVSLPVGEGCYPFIAYGSLFCFVSAIVSALLGFVYSDKGFDSAIHDHIERRSLAQEAVHFHHEFCNDVDSLNLQQETNYKVSVSAIFEKRDAKAALSEIDAINKKISLSNQAKTYFFIFGIILVSAFALLNADKLGTT